MLRKNLKYLFIYKFALFVVLAFFFSNENALASHDREDSLRVKANSFLILGNSTIFIKNDTVIFVPDTNPIETERRVSPKTQAFYDFIKEELYKNKLTRELYNILFTTPSKEPSPLKEETQNLEESENIFLPHEGKIIGNIRIKKLNVIGPSLEDTGRVSKSWVAKTANKFHIDTQDGVLRSNILIKKGDRLDPLLLSDNERVIRQMPFIRDTRILVVPRGEASDTVDILVLTQDVWSKSVDFRPRGFTSASVSLDDRNIFGFGHELINRISFDDQLNQKFGYEGIYRIPNLAGTFITAEVRYANSFYKDGYSFRTFRNFITPDIKYAGGLEISNMTYLTGINYADTTVQFSFQQKVQDIWIGRAYPTEIGSENLRDRSRFVTAARVLRHQFPIRPEATADTNQSYHKSTLLLASFGLSTRKYYKDRLIFGYGRTEDIPYGNLVEITTGVSLGEFYNRPYVGLTYARGGLFRSYGYGYLGLSAGSFIRNNAWQQGVLKIETKYFSNLIRLGNHRIRQFLNIEYTLGIRRFDDEFINIRDENGIRGLRNDFFLRGHRKIVVSAETVDFTPLNIMGFRVAIFGFADVAIIAPKDLPLLSGNLFQGYGLGFRVNNDHLTFSTFQLRLAYYPTVPPGVSQFGFAMDGVVPLRLDDFDIKAPHADLFE